MNSGSPDLLTAAAAYKRVSLLLADRDFQKLAEHFGLKEEMLLVPQGTTSIGLRVRIQSTLAKASSFVAKTSIPFSFIMATISESLTRSPY
jgi:hypothetical protein